MSNIPDDLRYTENHEWVRVEGDLVRIGITDHAQGELTDIVYVELPSTGDSLDAKGEIAIVESVKSTSDVFSPVAGEVIEANSDLEDTPELVNEDCYGKGWLAVIKPADMSGIEKLLTPAQYKELL
ncbi:MAG: glycine cleavage system protein GcvH [Thermoplasmata archaeon]|nr:glycine cleavage system protein GcvH [Thermoplasmata archaeon]